MKRFYRPLDLNEILYMLFMTNRIIQPWTRAGTNLQDGIWESYTKLRLHTSWVLHFPWSLHAFPNITACLSTLTHCAGWMTTLTPPTTPPPFGKPVIHLNNLLFILNKFRFYIFLFRISGSVIQSNPSTVCEINTFLKSFFHKLDCLFSPKYRRLITFLTLITLITFVICCLSQELMFPPCCRVSVS